MSIAAAVFLVAATVALPTTFVIDEPTDLILSGGTSLVAAPLYSLRR
jgi:hypothetical protein